MSELETFVLGYLQEVGGLSEAVAPGLHEVIIPDEVAQRWGVSAYQHLTFSETAAPDDISFTRLTYNHPLVEQIIEAARSRPAAIHFYVNDLRLSKEGLAELARSTWSLANARVVDLPQATTARVLNTYLGFNFKAALISDDKQEQLASLLLDAQAGYAAVDPDRIYQAASPHLLDQTLKKLPPGPMRWTLPDGQTPANALTLSTLQALLARAQTALLQTLDKPLSQLQQRSQRFHELDQARLNEYYDEIERDLQHRLSHASPDRQAGLEEKLASIAAERAAKLADAAERYQVRLELTLLNTMVISQPKLVLPIGLENRTTKVKTYAVWDPLLHRLELLACRVCGQPGQHLFLCHNGHLAHENCLAPACIDCKRVFCAVCAAEVGVCDVCRQPLCRHSRIICAECGRGTCQAHQGLCHADEGRPVDLRQVAPPPPEPEPPPPPQPLVKTTPKSKATGSKTKPAARAKPAAIRRAAPTRPKGVPKPQRIEVVVEHDTVAAYLLASRERQIAVRFWQLVPDEGIIIGCNCEKQPACPADNRVMRPADKAGLSQQLLDEIDRFRQEYGLPDNKVKFNRLLAGGQYAPTGRLALLGLWQDEKSLAAARDAFDRTFGRAR